MDNDLLQRIQRENSTLKNEIKVIKAYLQGVIYSVDILLARINLMEGDDK